MNYTLHQLNVFLKVAENKSVTKAAEQLHLTQPAVSIQLKKFQEQFDIPLTEVIGRQLFVTDFGQKIVEAGKRILAESAAIKTTVEQYKGLLSGTIKISVVSTGKYVIPYFLRSFMEKYPQVEIVIDVSNKNRVVEGLANNASDFSLVSVLPENIPVETLELMENKLFLVGSAQFSDLTITKKKLKRLTLIFREKGSATRNAMEQFLQQNEIGEYKSMELVSNEAVKQAVNAGLGFSIMPLIGLKNELAMGTLKIFPIQGLPVVTNWNLIHVKGKQLSPAADELKRFIRATRQETIEKWFNWE